MLLEPHPGTRGRAWLQGHQNPGCLGNQKFRITASTNLHPRKGPNNFGLNWAELGLGTTQKTGLCCLSTVLVLGGCRGAHLPPGAPAGSEPPVWFTVTHLRLCVGADDPEVPGRREEPVHLLRGGLVQQSGQEHPQVEVQGLGPVWMHTA